MRTWSVSSVKTWAGTCQLQWWFRRQGLKEESRSLPLVEGTVLHAVLAFSLRGMKEDGKMPPEEEALALLDAELFQEEMQGAVHWGKMTRDTLLERMGALYKHWREKFKPEGEILAVEEELRVALPGIDLPLLGYVDLVMKGPRGIEVIDFKVVASRPYRDLLFDPLDLQKLAMTRGYEAATRQPVTSWKWANLIKTKVPQLVDEIWEINQTDRDSDLARLRAVVNPSIAQMQAVLEGRAQPVPSQSFMAPCSSCGYRAACARWTGSEAIPPRPAAAASPV